MEALLEWADSQGVSRRRVFPFAWRALWRLGIKIPPPMCLGFFPLAAALGVQFGLWMTLVGLITGAFDQLGFLSTFVICGAPFGLLMASMLRNHAIQHDVPSWSEL